MPWTWSRLLMARRVGGRAAVDPGRCLRCRVVHRLRPVVALEQHSGASAIGDGIPWLVVSVRAVRKTEDILDTLIAVAVGALIAWDRRPCLSRPTTTTHSAPNNQSRLDQRPPCTVAGRGRVREVRRRAQLYDRVELMVWGESVSQVHRCRPEAVAPLPRASVVGARSVPYKSRSGCGA